MFNLSLSYLKFFENYFEKILSANIFLLFDSVASF